MANNYGAFVSAVPALLNVVDFAHRLVGPKPLEYISGALNRVSGHYIPEWNPYMPRARAPASLVLKDPFPAEWRPYSLEHACRMCAGACLPAVSRDVHPPKPWCLL